VKVITQL